MTQLYTLAHNLPAEPKRFLKFLVVGSIGFAVDFGTFNLIHYLYNVPTSTVDEIATQALSFSVATLSNFLWNYFWIYPEARDSSLAKKITKFLIVSVVGLVIRTPIFTLALPITHGLIDHTPLATWPINLSNNLALATAVGVVLLWNFFVNRYWTYRDVK